MRSLNRLAFLRNILLGVRQRWLRSVKGVDVASDARISLSATFVPGRAGAISIGPSTLVAFKTFLIAERSDGSIAPVRIGSNCFIGGGSVILPGVKVGDGSIVGANAIVDSDVPPDCAVGGNPARILRTGIDAGPYGLLPVATENSSDYLR